MSRILITALSAALCLTAAADSDVPQNTLVGSEADKFRSQLEEHGVTVGLSYLAESFSLVQGGQRTKRRSEYLGSLIPTLSLNLSRIGIGRGEFYMSAQSLHGRGISETHIGAAQAVSNLEDQKFSRFIEAWYADSYANGFLRVKAGRQYADSEFGVAENGADFLNSSYGLNPTTPMPTYPCPELGASAWIAPLGWFSFGVGVFKGGTLDPITEDGEAITRRPFTIFEARFEPFGDASSSHGSYSLGLWRQSRAMWLPDANAPVQTIGMYVTADHWFKRSPSGESRGPGLFFQYGPTPSDRNEITAYTGGGVAWAGVAAARRRDTVGLGLARVGLAGTRSENIIELFYKCRITSKLMVQPDLQWAIHPSGTGRNALVAGVRMGIEF